MSTRTRHWFNWWKEQFNLLRRYDFKRGGVLISERDKLTYCDALILRALLFEDLGFLSVCDVEASRWLRAVAKHDIIDVEKLWKAADSYLTRSYEEDNHSFDGFKLHLLPEYPWAVSVLRPLKVVLHRFFKNGCQAADFRALHQWFVFTSRVSFRDISDDEVIDDFVATDLALPDFIPITADLNAILKDWLKGFRVSGIPRHGPGMVSDIGSSREKSLVRKYQLLGVDRKILRAAAHDGFDVMNLLPYGHDSIYYLPYARKISRLARLQCVPKTALTKRTICMEPAALQYFQQMVAYDLQKWIAHHPVLRRHIRLEDQTFNREAACEGSFWGTDATVDLSKASDSVSWVLARGAFANTNLLLWLDATRSECVELPGSRGIMKAKKFAPMGSALCFPIECLIFAAICEYTSRIYGYPKGSVPWKVYGDDIIVPTELVPLLRENLEMCGFSMNISKSFTGMTTFSFRESCGGEYVNGVDVRPLRISRRFQGWSDDQPPLTADMYENSIEFANDSLYYGFLGVRRWILRRLLALPKRLQPVFGLSEGQLHQRTRSDNFGRARRSEPPNGNWYCREEVRAGCVKVPELSLLSKCSSPQQRDCVSDLIEEVRYMEWWWQALRDPEPRDNLGFFRCRTVPHVGPSDVPRLSSRWTPVDPPLGGETRFTS